MADLKVRAGEWDTQTTRERLPFQERNVEQIVLHKQFVPAGAFNDFALVILDTPFTLEEHIDTICIPEQNQLIESQDCVVTGWGKEARGEIIL